MLIGYARISTDTQSLDLQLDTLKQAGCEKLITDTASGRLADRPGLEQLNQILRDGDVLVVWRLDRLGRSLKHLIELVTELESRGVGFRSLTESIDTTSPGGKLVFHMFGALAEFERSIIVERTRAGLEAARARGRLGGRKRALSKAQRQLVVELYLEKKRSVKDLCESFGISKPTLYSYVREQRL